MTEGGTELLLGVNGKAVVLEARSRVAGKLFDLRLELDVKDAALLANAIVEAAREAAGRSKPSLAGPNGELVLKPVFRFPPAGAKQVEAPRG